MMAQPMPPPRRPASAAALQKRHSLKLVARKIVRRNKLEKQQREIQHQLETLQNVPIDLLATSWLSESGIVDLRTRVYLVEKCLGPVVMGLEAVLSDLEKRGIDPASESLVGRFNPVDFLAAFLMRNNPRYSNLNDSSPYAKSMQVVMEHLKDRLHAATGDSRSRVQADVQRRRERMDAEIRAQRLAIEAQLEPLLSKFPSQGLPAPFVTECISRYPHISAMVAFDADRQKMPDHIDAPTLVAILTPLLHGVSSEDVKAFSTYFLEQHVAAQQAQKAAEEAKAAAEAEAAAQAAADLAQQEASALVVVTESSDFEAEAPAASPGSSHAAKTDASLDSPLRASAHAYATLSQQFPSTIGMFADVLAPQVEASRPPTASSAESLSDAPGVLAEAAVTSSAYATLSTAYPSFISSFAHYA
ncbi:uncharacterized protein MONBRDRAFT_35629 [Monosiga brevicollis MX1]|uniref:Uncharacterized protein n=1 Tax=Monosiga brevicollis TaxID=81824 RepID=A9UQD7_MONBE|nr:uncharacterized protein MONBRDRAFT_35629 [Monosiga brevicollis MX1]EDQ93028.1 predicted protein [Monosiga brevicollis MX1]|eukprot:XP_001742790.1 hypothetical protein [Monosiga brevicollis MX1]